MRKSKTVEDALVEELLEDPSFQFPYRWQHLFKDSTLRRMSEVVGMSKEEDFEYLKELFDAFDEELMDTHLKAHLDLVVSREAKRINRCIKETRNNLSQGAKYLKKSQEFLPIVVPPSKSKMEIFSLHHAIVRFGSEGNYSVEKWNQMCQSVSDFIHLCEVIESAVSSEITNKKVSTVSGLVEFIVVLGRIYEEHTEKRFKFHKLALGHSKRETVTESMRFCEVAIDAFHNNYVNFTPENFETACERAAVTLKSLRKR